MASQPVVVARAVAPIRLSWGAILAGVASALAICLMLYTLGLGIGLSSIDGAEPGTLRASRWFASIWALVIPLVSLFIGGAVAGRGAGAITKGDGAVHGLVLWGITLLAGVWFLANVASVSIGGLVTMAGLGQGTSTTEQLAAGFGIDADDALDRVNERLDAAGRPTISGAQLDAAARDVIQDAIRKGRLDREMLVEALTERTDLSRLEASFVADRIAVQFEAARGQIEAAALQAARTAGIAFWWIFAALFVALLAAIAGATAGVSRRQRRWTAAAPAVTREVPL